MAYRLLAYLDGIEYNRKLFQIDGGEEDLPPIRDKVEITPGSEAHSLKVTTGRWKLDSNYQWIFVPFPGGYVDPAHGCIADVPRNPTNTCYVRVSDEMGVRSWEPVQIGSLTEMNVSLALIGTFQNAANEKFIGAKGSVSDMVRARVVFMQTDTVVEIKAFERVDGVYRCLIPEEADWFFVTVNNVPKLGQKKPSLEDALLCSTTIGEDLPAMTWDAWRAKEKKPIQAYITDSVFDMKVRVY